MADFMYACWARARSGSPAAASALRMAATSGCVTRASMPGAPSHCRRQGVPDSTTTEGESLSQSVPPIQPPVQPPTYGAQPPEDSAGIDGADAAEVEDLCRLLGAVAGKQKVPLTVMSSEQMTRCHEVAQEAATSATKP